MASPFDFAQQGAGDLSFLPPEIQARIMSRAAAPYRPAVSWDAPPGAMTDAPVQETAPTLGPHEQPGGSFMDRLAMALGNTPLPIIGPWAAPGDAFAAALAQGAARGFAVPRLNDIEQRRETQAAASEAARTLNAHRWSTYEKANTERLKFLQDLSLDEAKAKRAAATQAAENSPATITAKAKASRQGSLAAEAEAGTGDIAPTLTPDALDQAALLYGQTGQMIPAGMGKSGVAFRAAVANRWGEIASGKGRPVSEGGPTIASNKASYGADTSALKTLQSNLDAVTAFKGTALANAKQALDLTRKITDTGSPLANAVVRAAQQKVLGNDAVSNYNTAIAVVQPEFARILANPALTGQLTDAARKDIAAVVDRNFNRKQLAGAFQALTVDAENRRRNYQQQIETIRGRIRGGANAPGRLDLVPPGSAPVQWTKDANGNPVPAGGH